MAKITLKTKLAILFGVLLALTIGLILGKNLRSRQGLGVAFGAEFLTRPDGYAGLCEHYGFAFSDEPRQMVDGLLYKTLANGDVEIINAFSTDGRIKAYDLVNLIDDKHFFPPYYAAPLVRQDTLEDHPEIRDVLNGLAGRIDDDTMQELNYLVDEEGQSARDVARQFLLDQGLIPDKPVQDQRKGKVTVGSKEFTEQEILGELISILLEYKTDLEVERRLNLGGTIICFNALQAGDLDLYPEYTGTGLVNILKRDAIADPEKTYAVVSEEFEQRYDLIWLKPFGFNNTYTLTTTQHFAIQQKIKTISDLAAWVNRNQKKEK